MNMMQDRSIDAGTVMRWYYNPTNDVITLGTTGHAHNDKPELDLVCYVNEWFYLRFYDKKQNIQNQIFGENMPAVILFYRISFSEQNDIFALFKHYTSNIHDELIEASNVISNDHASDKTMILMELLLILRMTNLNWNWYV